jgi:hypothetical protein
VNAASPPTHYPGDFVMLSVDQTSLQPIDAAGRKRWETPTVIVGSAQRETLSNQNSGGVDVVYSSVPSSIGS